MIGFDVLLALAGREPILVNKARNAGEGPLLAAAEGTANEREFP
jgi:hypothetical protein